MRWNDVISARRRAIGFLLVVTVAVGLMIGFHSVVM